MSESAAEAPEAGDSRAAARALRDAHLAGGDPTGWFEALYAQAGEATAPIPWADLVPNPLLLAWLAREGDPGGPAVKVGCGLGDDAEHLAARGLDVTAFDVAPSAVAGCRRRFPDSPVHYAVADLLALPADWRQAFAFVLESYTLQVLPPELQPDAMRAVASLVAPGGRLLLIARGREPDDPTPGLHWPLTRAGLSPLREAGLAEESFEDFLDDEEPPVRRFLAVFRRA